MTDFKWSSDIPVELVSFMGSDMEVARSAWVSTMGERVEDESDPKRVEGLINYLMRDRHGSPFEQCVMRWRVKAPIFVWREHHRHRVASYNEESGRYKELNPEFYIPDHDRNLIQTGSPGHYNFSPGTITQYDQVVISLKHANREAYLEYQNMLSIGVAREVARMCLPVNIFSTCYVTMNLRALMNFLSLRVKHEESAFPSNPQREIQMVAEQYEDDFEDKFPFVHAAFIKNRRVQP